MTKTSSGIGRLMTHGGGFKKQCPLTGAEVDLITEGIRYRAYQDASGAKLIQKEEIGRSSRSSTTVIHEVVDLLRKMGYFKIARGHFMTFQAKEAFLKNIEETFKCSPCLRINNVN